MRMKRLAVGLLVAALSLGSAMSAMAASWEKVGTSDWKYKKDDGTYMASQWLKHTDGKWYYLGADTLMKKGWFLDTDGKWYFLDSNGAMQTGVIEVDGKAYYMDESGALFIGDRVVYNRTYNFGLYGSTNGNPYTALKFKGNGDKVVTTTTSSSHSVSGGKSYSSSSSVLPSATTASLAEAKEEIQEIASTEVVESVTVSAPVASSSTAATVTVKAVLGTVTEDNITEAQAAVSSAVDSVVSQADADSSVKVSIGSVSKTYTYEEFLNVQDALVENWVTLEKLNSVNTNSGTIVVKVNGVEVTYKISVTK